MSSIESSHNNLTDQSQDQSSQHIIESEMISLDRLNLLAEMAATVGHEVRNPMTAVRGFLQMLQLKNPTDENTPYYNLMIEELDRANQIIDEFLSIARQQQVDLKPGSISHIVESLQPLIQAQALMKNLNLLIQCESYAEVRLNESQIRQMIINLACNGLEAMVPPGTLSIGTKQTKTEVILYVHDQGPGITTELLDKISAPFFTTKNQGTGLGLPVCYNIADHHNAHIDISTGSKGTTFSVHFPLPI